MSLIMMKTSQLSPLAFTLYKTYCPAGISAVAGLMQQQVQQSANLRNRQCRRIFFSPAVFHRLKTMLQ